jgi:hypothetical protein
MIGHATALHILLQRLPFSVKLDGVHRINLGFSDVFITMAKMHNTFIVCCRYR